MSPAAITAVLGVLYVVSHLVMSHGDIRAGLIARLGVQGFRGAYSLVASVLWLPMGWLWWTHTADAPSLWSGGVAGTRVAELLIGAGTAITVAAAIQPSRASIAAQMRGGGPRTVRGMAAFGRHPLFFGLGLFSIGHLVADASPVDLAFHGSNLALAVLGTWHQDARMMQSDPHYPAYAAQSRLVFLPWPVAGATVGALAWIGLAVGVGVAVAARYALH